VLATQLHPAQRLPATDVTPMWVVVALSVEAHTQLMEQLKPPPGGHKVVTCNNYHVPKVNYHIIACKACTTAHTEHTVACCHGQSHSRVASNCSGHAARGQRWPRGPAKRPRADSLVCMGCAHIRHQLRCR